MPEPDKGKRHFAFSKGKALFWNMSWKKCKI